MDESQVESVATLRRIAFLLEQVGEPSYRSRAFRRAADAVASLTPAEFVDRVQRGSLAELPGVGPVTAGIVAEAVQGEDPAYLVRLQARAAESADSPGGQLWTALRGDCHVHSDWSDGVAPIQEMAKAAVEMGAEYIVLTDHSPTLRIARGLSPDRLRAQLDVVAGLNSELAPFRILTGIEVDILPDGTLDQEEELLARLDVVVGSVHSQLRMEREAMTERLLRAIANPHLDILGHCTGRMKTRRRDRPESEFDSARVFAACARLGKAVEVNSLRERRDPPRRLMREALAEGCLFAIDSDAHAPGAISGRRLGCDRAADVGIPPERVVNTLTADDLVDWARGHGRP